MHVEIQSLHIDEEFHHYKRLHLQEAVGDCAETA